MLIWEDRFVIQRELRRPNPPAQSTDDNFVASVMTHTELVMQSHPIQEFTIQAEAAFPGGPGSMFLIWVFALPSTPDNEDVQAASVDHVMAVLQSQQLPAKLVVFDRLTESATPAELPAHPGIAPGYEGFSEE